MRLSEAIAALPWIEIRVSGARGVQGEDGPVGPPGGMLIAASIAAMATMAAAITPDTGIYLINGDRSGLFELVDDDLSAMVALDTDKGIYVAPEGEDGSTGALVRHFDGPIMADWFGLAGDDDPAAVIDGTNDGPAVQRMFNVVDRNIPGLNGRQTIRFGAKFYFMGSSEINVRHIGIVEGAGKFATRLRWESGYAGCGFIPQRVNTADGLTGTEPAWTVGGADDGTIRMMWLYGGYDGTENDSHAIAFRSRGHGSDLYIQNWAGNGIHSDATAAGSPEGNANCNQLSRVTVTQCTKGIYTNGADTNVWNIFGCDMRINRTWGYDLSDFLGQTLTGCHAAGNGWDGALGSIPTGTTFMGNRYYVKIGQAAWCKTHAPSGTTADNQGWGYMGAGGTYNGIVAWVSGTDFREGGAYRTDTGNSNTVIDGCYSEGDSNPSQLAEATLVIGGLHGAGVIGGTHIKANNGFGSNSTGWEQSVIFAGGPTIVTRLGGRNPVGLLNIGNNAADIFSFSHSVYAPDTGNGGWRFGPGGAGYFQPDDLCFDFNGGTYTPFKISGPSTTQQFGTGVAQPGFFFSYNFALGNSVSGETRKVGSGSAAPTTGAHAAGERVFNDGTATSCALVDHWLCTAAGTPGTWIAVPPRETQCETIALSDETTAITSGAGKLTMHWPFAFTVDEVFIGLSTVSSSGAVTVDMNKNGVSIFSTAPSIEASEETSLTGTAAVIGTASIAKGDKITFDVDAAGTGAKGLKAYVIGRRG